MPGESMSSRPHAGRGARRGTTTALTLVSVGLSLAAALWLQGAPSRPETIALLPAATPPEAMPQFVGGERCRICHQDISIDFLTNPHADKPLEIDGEVHTGCETCHGGGADHASSLNRDLIGRFNQGNPASESAVCLNCHKWEGTHPDRFFDAHQAESIGCTSCHSVHNSGDAATPLPRTSSNQLCANCHPTERAETLRPFAHRIDDNLMQCTDCHQPHGSPSGFQLSVANANEAACFNCHSDKRGPFAFEHMPSAVGGCVSCHDPHGSPNPRMLVRHQVRLVCLECHTNSTAAFGATPPAFHDLRSPRFENCTLCHTRIHGSHVSPALLR
jgi:DmsE family decaheme c-type cytochrome